MKSILPTLASMLLLASCATNQSASPLGGMPPGTFVRHGDITLDLKSDKASYRDGEPVTISLTTSRRASIRIFNEDADGNRAQLWPNAHSGSSDIVEPGKTLVIPARGSAFALRAGKPYGTNTIVAVAASAPFRPTVTSDDFFVDRSTTKQFARKGIAWTPATVTGDANTPTGEARFLYEVKQP